MRHFKMPGTALIAILALSIGATSAAQAVELKLLPELAKFAFKSTSATKLGTLSGKEITCASVSGSGEATSPRLGNMTFTFKGCEEPKLKVKCTGLSNGVAGEITVTAAYHLRHLLSPLAEDVNLSILVTAAHFSCLGILFTVSGCVTSDDLKALLNGQVLLWLAGHLESIIIINFLLTAGMAVVTEIDTDNSLGMEACTLLTKQEAGTGEISGQEGTGEIEQCKSGEVACTFLIDLSGTA